MERMLYDLSVESQATSFDELYLLRKEENYLPALILETSLQDMQWGKYHLRRLRTVFAHRRI